MFRDVHSIGVGKWRDQIDTALADSAVCIAVIGPRWANADNLSRLHDDGDMVRHELVRALATSELTVVPTLVEGAVAPKAADLPAELRPLLDVWNARWVTEDGWEDDIRRLIAEIAESTQIAAKPDLDTLLHDAGAALQRVAELEQTRRVQADRAIFPNILDFCARLLAIQRRRGVPWTSDRDPRLGLPLVLVRSRAVRFSSGRLEVHQRTNPLVGTVVSRRGQAATFSDGHVWQDAERFASTRARRAAAARDLRSGGTASPVPKYISSGVCPRNAECGSTWLCSWT